MSIVSVGCLYLHSVYGVYSVYRVSIDIIFMRVYRLFIPIVSMLSIDSVYMVSVDIIFMRVYRLSIHTIFMR